VFVESGLMGSLFIPEDDTWMNMDHWWNDGLTCEDEGLVEKRALVALHSAQISLGLPWAWITACVVRSQRPTTKTCHGRRRKRSSFIVPVFTFGLGVITLSLLTRDPGDITEYKVGHAERLKYALWSNLLQLGHSGCQGLCS